MLKTLVQYVTNPTKMVLIVRSDLKMGPGKIAAQCSHAAVTLYTSAINSSSVPLKSWLFSGQPKIVLKVQENSESVLKELHQVAKEQNLNSCLIYDAGRTQVEKGTLTVLGIGPANSSCLDNITKGLKLL